MSSAVVDRPYFITRLQKPEFEHDLALLARLAEIIRPSYEHANQLLGREIAHCNTLYLLSTEAEQVATFFLIAEESLCVRGAHSPSVYLGLSATSQQTKNTALVRELYTLCAADIRERERVDGCPRTIWFTTATPSAYYGGSLYWNVEPLADGSHTAQSRDLADAICEQMLFEQSPDSPFCLRGVAGAVRYSLVERNRIARVVTKTGFTLFEQLRIDESHGDRLLVVGSSKHGSNQ
jgi:hypothetical protein